VFSGCFTHFYHFYGYGIIYNKTLTIFPKNDHFWTLQTPVFARFLTSTPKGVLWGGTISHIFALFTYLPALNFKTRKKHSEAARYEISKRRFTVVSNGIVGFFRIRKNVFKNFHVFFSFPNFFQGSEKPFKNPISFLEFFCKNLKKTCFFLTKSAHFPKNP